MNSVAALTAAMLNDGPVQNPDIVSLSYCVAMLCFHAVPAQCVVHSQFLHVKQPVLRLHCTKSA
jgi:hypothetical protein